KSTLDSEKSEHHAKILKLASQLQQDVRKGEQERKGWLNWNDQKFPAPVLLNSKNPRENFLENFQLPMKAMALSLRFKPNWEQTSKRLPEHVISWVNDYASRRRLFIEDASPSWDLEEATSAVIEDLNNSSITDSFSLLEEQVAAIVDTTYEESPPESIVQITDPTSCSIYGSGNAETNNRHVELVQINETTSLQVPKIDQLTDLEKVSKGLSQTNTISDSSHLLIESEFKILPEG
ncbi:unnamed protein product, partial [Allacma fusca]